MAVNEGHFNILPLKERQLQDLESSSEEHAKASAALMDFVEVRQAKEALYLAGLELYTKSQADLPSSSSSFDSQSVDLMDWLGHVFRFQADNVRNQRENVILLVANHMMRSKKGMETDVRQEELELKHSITSLHDKLHSKKDTGTDVRQEELGLSITFLHDKLLNNYEKWCRFVGKRHNLQPTTPKLSYMCLYLLIWGEAANLRFMPECLCFIFHNMANKLNKKLEIIGATGTEPDTSIPIQPPNQPKTTEEHSSFGFLEEVIKPIYDAVKAEAHGSRYGKAPHSSWRNYDDMNEFFWSEHCFTQLGWPYEPTSDYLTNVPRDGRETEHEDDNIGQYESMSRETSRRQTIPQRSTKWSSGPHDPEMSRSQSLVKQRSFGHDAELATKPTSRRVRRMKRDGKKIGFKVGFVEQRSFWNIYHSFHRLWFTQLLVLQALVILAFSGDDPPWVMLLNRDIQARLLYLFITWAALRAVQALVTIVTQFTLISLNAKLLALRMVLKLLASFAWITIFSIMLAQMEEQRARDDGWSEEASLMFLEFLVVAGVFLLPEIMALLLFLIPCIANMTEKSESIVIRVVMWWFHTRSYVGRGMHQDLPSTLSYTFFWLAILVAKISFSYFLQIRPLVGPTRDLLRLKDVQFEWFQFFKNHNRFVVAVLWAPVVLIYLMDTQIWYSIFSSLVGALVGLLSHIGEIRNLQQFRIRFPFFASAITFNLLPDKQVGRSSLRLIRDMVKRLMIRYGLDRRFESLGPTKLAARQFACLWNCIITTFREEDIISNKEEEWLKMPSQTWAIEEDIIHWPLVLLSNDVAHALHVAKKCKDDDTIRLWRKVTSNEYRKSAVKEAFYSLKYLLEEVIWKKERAHESQMEQRWPPEREAVKHVIDKIKQSCQESRPEYAFLARYKARELESVHSHVLKLLEALLRTDLPAETHEDAITTALINLMDSLVMDLPKEKSTIQDLMNELKIKKGTNNSDHVWFHDTVQRPDPTDKELHSQLRRLHFILSTKEAMETIPNNLEARRRLAFFSNSLFMAMPRASSVDKMLAFTVLTPYYKEEVMYTTFELQKENEDGINIQFYLTQIFPDEWENVKERTENFTRKEDDQPLAQKREYRRAASRHRKDDQNLELRQWASYRGQTLARTVRGMMYYQRALEVLAHLESTAPDTRGLEGLKCTPREKAAALLKFTYVIACQAYKELKDGKDDQIQFLMRKYPAVRVAYVSETGIGKAKSYWSILLKYDPCLDQIVEIYKIKLPGPFLLGEGKPENQNQAIIFTRGEALQTIDMNQDNYFEEALKVRNLLQEFEVDNETARPRILGIREHVFTGSVSSLAHFMSTQEMSFVTISQRVLANPLRIRMHYGHPDMFDRLWFLARGGISKASHVLNISEDIFAGFNCTLRGGKVTHHEYIQVGKGRDVGLNQITRFEAKIASGNGEQMLSRDVYRLGHRLDYFRMFSFYYTTVGFYFSSLLVVLAAYAFLWGRVFVGLSGIENAISSGVLSNAALETALNQQLVVQVGMFSSLPMVVEMSLEQGFTDAAWQFLLMQLQFCFVFYTFSLGTKAHYFGRTLLHGGATYRSTGRDFVIKREAFVTIYRNHSRSHFVKGVELIVLLLIYETYSTIARNTTVYTLMTLSYWFLALTWIIAPFLFNPSAFDWLQTVYDYEGFQTWLWQRRGMMVGEEESWEVWWNKQQEHLDSTGFWGRVVEVVISVRFFLIQYGMVYHLQIASRNKSLLVYLVSWTYVVVAVVVYIVVARAKDKYGAKEHIYYRAIQWCVLLFIVMVIVLLVELTDFRIKDLFLSMLAFLPTGWGLLCMAAVGKPYLQQKPVWLVVTEVARLYDLAIGLIVLAPVAVLSWLPGFQNMQTRILFNQAFSRGLQISRLLAGKKTTYRGSY